MTVRTSRKTVTFARPFSLRIDRCNRPAPTRGDRRGVASGFVVSRLRRIATPIFLRRSAAGRSWRSWPTSIRSSCKQIRKMPAGTPRRYHGGYLDQDTAEEPEDRAGRRPGILDLLIRVRSAARCCVVNGALRRIWREASLQIGRASPSGGAWQL